MYTFSKDIPDKWADGPPRWNQLERHEWKQFALAADAAGMLTDWDREFLHSVMNQRRPVTAKQGAVLDRIIVNGWMNDPALWDGLDENCGRRLPEHPNSNEIFRLNLSREDVEVVKTSLGIMDFGDE